MLSNRVAAEVVNNIADRFRYELKWQVGLLWIGTTVVQAFYQMCWLSENRYIINLFVKQMDMSTCVDAIIWR